MQSTSPLAPMHMNITAQALKGNGRLGRYILLPGSDGRAEAIAQRLQNVTVLTHNRRHNFYKGTWQNIDIGVMSSGMGCPSMDIIATELLHQGARRLIRVGTAGSLQPERLRIGSLVIPTAAVRDEGTSRHYLDPTKFLWASRIPKIPFMPANSAKAPCSPSISVTWNIFMPPVCSRRKWNVRSSLR